MGAERGHLDKIHDSVEFYDHQAEGVRAIARQGNVILADEMGLGKTLQALAVAALDFQRGVAKRVLVITLATLKGNWAEEITLHTSFTYTVLHGTPKQRQRLLETFDADILIVNYEQVIAHWEDLNALGFDVILYDEAHAIKNRSSERTKACRKVQGARRIPITGSPLLNNVDDLWTLLNIVDPEAWPNYWKFRNRYCVFGGFQGRQVVGVKNEAELHRKLSGVMLRRKKIDVIDLPEKQYIPVWVDLTHTQSVLYDEALKEQQLTIPGEPDPMQLENALVRMLRLKEIVGSAGTVEGYGDESSKLDVMVDKVKEIIALGEPVVIFTQFRAILRFIEDRIMAHGIPVWTLHGDVPFKDRVPRINEWTEHAQKGDNGALACMFQVGGVGLNMTAASKVILVDRLYVPKLNEQAVDRLHRIGADTTKPIQIIELLARKTIDRRITSILKRKDSIFGAVVDGSWKKDLVAAVLRGGDDDDA